METLSEITHVYLFTSKSAVVVPGTVSPNYSYSFDSLKYLPSPAKSTPKYIPLKGFTANPIDAPDGLVYQYHLPVNFPTLPPGATEERRIELMFKEGSSACDDVYRLRVHSSRQYHDFTFKLTIQFTEEDPPAPQEVDG